MSKAMPKLGVALDRKNWQELLDEDEDIANALEAEVRNGATPDEVRRFIMQHLGDTRVGRANRCMSAARYLQSVQAQ